MVNYTLGSSPFKQSNRLFEIPFGDSRMVCGIGEVFKDPESTS